MGCHSATADARQRCAPREGLNGAVCPRPLRVLLVRLHQEVARGQQRVQDTNPNRMPISPAHSPSISGKSTKPAIAGVSKY